MGNITGKKILLVDDDKTFVDLYSAVFNDRNINFSIARNGVEALQKAATELPDLILLDIMLPDINGLDVLKKLKQDSNTKNITVWVISNLSEQLNFDAAKALGAEDYLIKASYTPNQVIERINILFKGSTDKPLQ